MNVTLSTDAVAAWCVATKGGFAVTCSCGYTVTGWPTLALANADLENHWQRCHVPDGDDA